MKYLLLHLSLLLGYTLNAQNLQLRANLPYSPDALANIGGYTDSLDNEYALVGTEQGLDIVDVSDPDNPVIRFSVAGASSTWREVKTYRKYAYVTTEGGGGLTIVDLSNLPASVNSRQYTGDGAINGQLSSIHALHCDTAMAYLYLYGSNIGSGHTLFLDLSDPWDPAFAGEYIFPGGGNDSYVHDGYVENDTMYEAHIYGGFFTVVDVTNKSNPVLLATQTTPTAFTHNTWLSDDHKTLFTTDENNYSFLGAYDISDLQNIRELSRYQTAPGGGSVVHNTHIHNDYAVTSWYKEGVVIVDVSRPANPVEVAKFDTYQQGSGTGQTGCWGVYPFLPSGTIVASDMVNGLFVLTPTYVRGCYLEGVITDSLNGAMLQGALIEITGTAASKLSDAIGEYKTGLLAAGLYDVEISKAGYQDKVITGVSLANGVLTILDVQLSPLPTFSVSGTVLDSLSGLPLENASVLISNTDFTFNSLTDLNGEFLINGIIAGNYDISAGKWGYVTRCINQDIISTGPVLLELPTGYYDDFTFDYNWTVSGSSPNEWERGVPVASYDGNNDIVNPGIDASGDCSNKCYVTDNGTGVFNNHDVDNGNTRLTSPVFDAGIYVNPVLEYARWFVNSGGSGNPDDTMNIYLSNGTDMVLVDAITINSPGTSSWFDHSVLISSLISPSSTMQLIVDIEDESPGHILEGGIDHFRISGMLNVGIAGPDHKPTLSVAGFPNPFTESTTLKFSPVESGTSARLEVLDPIGKICQTVILDQGTGQIEIGRELRTGLYFARIISANGNYPVFRIMKQ
jgi:choice-of-anchor B domain-containing protein